MAKDIVVRKTSTVCRTVNSLDDGSRDGFVCSDVSSLFWIYDLMQIVPIR